MATYKETLEALNKAVWDESLPQADREEANRKRYLLEYCTELGKDINCAREKFSGMTSAMHEKQRLFRKVKEECEEAEEAYMSASRIIALLESQPCPEV